MKISVISVCKNSVSCIEKTIQSVLAQSYAQIEYLIIDGGSTDGTLEVIARYQSEIDYFVSEADCGIYDAMNKGAQAAQGDAIFYLNAGDYFYDQDVVAEVAALFLENLTTDLVYGNVFPDNPDWKPSVYGDGLTIKRFKQGQTISHQAVFIRRNVLGHGKLFEEQYRYAADYDLLCRLFKRGIQVKYLDRYICRYDTSGVSRGNSALEYQSILLTNFGPIWFLRFLFLRLLNKYWNSLRQLLHLGETQHG